MCGLGIATLRNASIRNETQMGALYLKLHIQQLEYDVADRPQLQSANGTWC